MTPSTARGVRRFLPPHPYGAVDRSWKERGRTVDGKGQKKVMQGRSHDTLLVSISSVSSIGASTAEEWVGIKKNDERANFDMCRLGECKFGGTDRGESKATPKADVLGDSTLL